MLRILIALILMTTPAFATVQWRNGTGIQTLLGNSSAADIDTNTYNNMVKPLDNLLATYNNQVISYASAATLTVSAGSVTVSNSDGLIRLMLINVSPTTLAWADLDTGAEASGTVYYVYAIGASASATAATYKISASSTAPSGVSFYTRIGSFTNDASSNITAIANNIRPQYGAATSKSDGVTYQALTDGEFIGVITCGSTASAGRIVGVSDGSSSPSTSMGAGNCIINTGSISQTSVSTVGGFSFPVKAGDYYKGTLTESHSGSAATAAYYFVPLS